MKKEVEILVEVFDSKQEVLEKLKDFEFLGDKKVLDVYLFDPLKSDLKPDKNGQLKKCLRLRKKADKAYLTYKLDNFDEKGIWLYSDEHETEIVNFEETLDIFKSLGFEELIKLENLKSTFKTEKYEIVLETVNNLGIFIEVERHDVADDEDIIKVKDEIWAWIKNLNIKTSLELTMGKPELMLRKNKAHPCLF